MEVFIGSIMTFGFNYAPYGWSFCNGQLVPLQQSQALFALLGTLYGGNGVNNFALPDLQGRIPVGQGQGAGLTPRTIAQHSGSESVTLLQNNLPPHTHTITSNLVVNTQISLATEQTSAAVAPTATNSFVGAGNPTGPGSANIFSSAIGNNPVNQSGVTSAVTGSVTAAVTGTGAPFGTMNPFLVLNFSIALQGIYPSRN
ncbi:tail fiber protein [Pseudomonas sp. DTU_2021_1001937_2_SI_NGA_ILE_001]|uniref:phage tail protein n=1 Tax=Pseudomonas sp. DTU_2021_1001937_2_SI_NGA_ILE_001 TaxID=3077589 RepID=UPI0028FC1776|nr:tail fiber protein [Pseudomonas sp. DTU_2021_1001937_2_SI_NGA_ILE_001]WNW12304.1 tail fiber protein [Pseudomonas sp. DTU_2021_1001937_2_SI_NGA_ILE_001]